MATKLAKDLKLGDIIVICDDEKSPVYRAFVSFPIMVGQSLIDRVKIRFVRIDGIEHDHQDIYGAFWTDNDAEFELVTLPPLNSKPVSNENAAFIAEETFKAGFAAGQDAADDNEWGEPARLKAWRSYEPPQDVLSCMAGTPDPEER